MTALEARAIIENYRQCLRERHHSIVHHSIDGPANMETIDALLSVIMDLEARIAQLEAAHAGLVCNAETR